MKTIKTKIVGVTYKNSDGSSRQDIIRNRITEGQWLALIREPENPFGKTSIAVFIDEYDLGEDRRIGYLKSQLTSDLAEVMDAGEHISCKVLQVTGRDTDVLGVNIELSFEPLEIADDYSDEIDEDDSGWEPSHDYKPVYDHTPSTISSVTTNPIKKGKRRSDKNFLILLILFFTLGYFGAHRWYVGRGSWIYTLTIGYFLIGWTFDLLMIIIGQFKDGHGYPIKP